jgi:two-component system, sensor histidine kinase RegB
MSTPPHTAQSWFSRARNAEPVEVLWLLFWLRSLAVGSQAAVIGAVHFGLGIELPLPPLAMTLGALTAWNVFVYVRVRRRPSVRQEEVAAHLAVDVAAFTSVIYFTGGPTNPFVSLYLVPISLAAASLASRYAWFIGGMCAAAYTLLLARHVPLPSVHGRFGGDFDLHVAGMWVNFLVAAAIIVFFVGRMAWLVRQRDRELAALREAALRDQRIVELGTLAAGTAHELNTPLSTLALLVEELQETTIDPERRSRLGVMNEQIEVINRRLNRIVGRVGADRSEGARCASLGRFIDDVVEQWQRANPQIDLTVSRGLTEPDLSIVAEATIEQAIRNVLDNAAHATTANKRRDVEVLVAQSGEELSITVIDNGAGLEPAVQDEVGLRVLSTKDEGLGIGLLLSRAALQHFGGRLELEGREAGGVQATIHLPLEELTADAH